LSFLLDPIPEPLIDESEKQTTENPEDQFAASLPPELRKLMEQTKQREQEEAAAAAAAAEAQNKEESMVADDQDGKNLTQMSLDRKKSIKDEQLFNGKFILS
jgi:hypothetical protein